MRTTRRIGVLLSLLCLLVASAIVRLSGPATASSVGTVKGRVVLPSGVPASALGGLAVQLTDATDHSATGTTDASGAFTLTDVPAASYTLRISPVAVTTVGMFQGGVVTVTGGSTTSVPTVTMPIPSKITFNLVVPSTHQSEPFEAVVYANDGGAVARKAVTPGANTIAGLATGDYTVAVSHVGTAKLLPTIFPGDVYMNSRARVVKVATSGTTLQAGTLDFTTPVFTDLGVSAQFAGEIGWLADLGVTTGHADGSLRPTASISREAMAAFLYRVAGRPSFTAPRQSPFSDEPVSSQFYTEIAWFTSTGITKGCPDGTYGPGATVSREAMAAFLMRYDTFAKAI